MLERLTSPLPSGLVLGVLACVTLCAAGLGIGYGFGYRYADALGAKQLAEFKEGYEAQARQAAEQNSLRLQQQVTRANQAEALMLKDRDQFAQVISGLEERIENVTTVFKPTHAAAPVAIPHCVFTVGWLRDYNTALGVPGADTGPVTSHGGQAPWAAPGTDAQLLEAPITQADILAHAQDYGRWANNAVSQVTALLATKEGCKP